MTILNTPVQLAATQLTFSASPTPLAIVGMGCHFPGAATSPSIFWENLMAAKDCIVDVPADRWEINRFYATDRNKPGKMYVKSGGFLQDSIFEFDALFFGVSPREAAAMDPQQRILMEVSWQALEDAGIDPDTLAGTETGVFVGGFMLDNKLTQLNPLNRHTITSNTAVGMTLTMLSNRISYFYDLRGPSMTIDTACSASMVALDQACHSIWNGNSQLALIGGVNIMHRPEMFISLCKGSFLAPDGRSKAFDASADGYGRGEGAGMIVVKPLADAERDGDKIYGLIRATGCNQDGRTDGITVPNADSQKALIRKVSHKANVDLRDISYFEAHGTGTAVGDPIEMAAIGATIGQARRKGETCIVGSVKSSIGHLEAASGIAGVIKSALCLQHKTVPPQANLQALNPKIPFADLQLSIPRQPMPLADSDEPLYTGINSFGYGGTNACAIFQSYTPPVRKSLNSKLETVSGKRFVLPLSARSKPALIALVQQYLALVSGDSINISDLCYSAGDRRAQMSHRLSVAADNLQELRHNLDQFLQNIPNEAVTENQIGETRGKLAFVFTGMGPQWWAMGRELLHSEPVYRASVARCDRLFKAISGWSIMDELAKSEAESRISETQIAQPANFVLQIALVELWSSWGIKPAAIVGHSVGEVASAYISGILSLEQALTVSFQRSRIQKKAANQGSMLAVGLNQAQAEAAIAPFASKVSIAAINGPTAVTLAGDDAALKCIAISLDEQGAFNRLLQVEVAYHSPTMDPLLAEIRVCLAGLTPVSPSLRVYSTVTGERITDSAFDAEYWCNNVRKPVYFHKAMEQMLADGYEDFLEIGPHPVLSPAIKECFANNRTSGFLASSLNRTIGEQSCIKQAVAALYTHGYAFNWASLSSSVFAWDDNSACCEAVRPQYKQLPAYPWQREYYWNDAPQAQQDRTGQAIGHAVLGVRQDGPTATWLSQINTQYLPYLMDHQVEGLTILPGAAYIEAALSAHNEIFDDDACLLTDIRLHNAMVIDADDEPLMQTSYNAGDSSFEIHSHQTQDRTLHTLHASGKLQTLQLRNHQTIDIAALQVSGMQLLRAAEIYTALAARGLQYGPNFQGIQKLWRKPGEVLAAIRVQQPLQLPTDNYQLHPTVLDACFQSLLAALPEEASGNRQVYIPVGIEQLRYYRKTGAAIYCHGTVKHIEAASLSGDITLCDENGKVLAEICGLRCQALRSTDEKSIEDLDAWTYQGDWQPLDTLAAEGNAAPADTACYLLLLNEDKRGKALQLNFEKHADGKVITVVAREAYTKLSESHYSFNPQYPQQLGEIFNDQAGFRDYAGLKIVNGLAMNQHSDDPTHLQVTGDVLEFIQTVHRLCDNLQARIYLLTQDAHRVLAEDRCGGFQQSAVIGLARVAAVEMPSLGCTLIDLDSSLSSATLRALVAECASDTAERQQEQEVALRDGARFGYRLCHKALDDAYHPELIRPSQDCNFVLAARGPAQHGNTSFQLCARRGVADNEVEIKVLSAVLHSHSANAESIQEVCAEVVSYGKSVAGLAVGEQIVACYRGQPGRYITLARSALLFVKKPDNWLPSAAAGALSGFALAHTALLQHGNLKPELSLLILGSDTASGQCLLQLAKARGCDCVAVAVDVDEHSSENLALNSASLMNELAGLQREGGFDLIVSTVGRQPHIHLDSLLADSGRLIEILDHEVGSPPAYAMSSGKVQIRLSKSKVVERTLASPALASAQLQEVFAELDSDGVHLPVLTSAALPAASDQPGVLSLEPGTELKVIARNSASVQIKSNASYLISGGFGGFGLGMAHWLVAQGARHLILVSRSGARTESAKQAVGELENAGAQVLTVATDIADAAAVKTLLQTIAADMPPLAGIFHTAGVLDDKELLSIDRDSLAALMRPKALGAWNLHSLTQHIQLDCFVLYSSVSSLIGNRNQGNYVAANLFLDNLAHFRHAHNLAATSINWGALAAVGMAADVNITSHLAHIGIHAFSQQQALEAFARSLQTPVAQLGIFDVDWQRWKQFEPASGSARFMELVQADDAQEDTNSWPAMHGRGPAALAEAITQCFSEMLSTTLKLTMQQIDLTTPINRYGLDSLMAIDLQMQIRDEFKVDISILELMKGNSITKLAEVIANKLGGLVAQQAGSTAAETTPNMAVIATAAATSAEPEVEHNLQLEVEDLSEDELDALLLQEMELNC